MNPNSRALDPKLTLWLDSLALQKMSHEIVQTAFTHPSYKGIVPGTEDYERLEFLGDSVLDLVAAEELVKHSTGSEGVMTEQRKALVSNDFLSQVYERLKMEAFTRTAVNYMPSIKDKANYVEAFFGAVFCEFDYKKCRDVWKIIQKRMGHNPKKQAKVPLSAEEKQNKDAYLAFYRELGLAPKNAKSMLQELCQKQNLPIPEYILLDRTGPDHNPSFRVKVSAVVIDQIPKQLFTAIGIGRTKKIAEIKAAEALCKQISLEFVSSK